MRNLSEQDRREIAGALAVLQERLGFWHPDTCNHRYQETNVDTGRTYCIECNVTVARAN